MGGSDKYIPALGHGWLTPLYDPLIRCLMPEVKLKTRLVEQARIERGHRVLDLGCGTGTLAILVKQILPESVVVGMDGDPRVLEIARRKAKSAGLGITFDPGMAFDLPYSEDSFDRVLSSFVIHHLTTENKVRAFNEIFRVLRAGGRLGILDFGKPYSTYGQLTSRVLRRFEETIENIQGLLPEMLRNAGLDQVDESEQFTTLIGNLSLYTACKPPSPSSPHPGERAQESLSNR